MKAPQLTSIFCKFTYNNNVILLVWKGIYHYWFLCLFLPGGLSKWQEPQHPHWRWAAYACLSLFEYAFWTVLGVLNMEKSNLLQGAVPTWRARLGERADAGSMIILIPGVTKDQYHEKPCASSEFDTLPSLVRSLGPCGLPSTGFSGGHRRRGRPRGG